MVSVHGSFPSASGRLSVGRAVRGLVGCSSFSP